MRIAILGTRGIPGRYGGFETLAEQLSKRLAADGHEVTVYCRRPFTKADDVVDPRIRRVILPTISNKYFDTAFHTFLSAIHVLFIHVEIVLICNVANSAVAWIPRLFGIPTVLNVDGLDRKRRKWNLIARTYLYFCELLSLITPTRIITDAPPIQEYFWKRYRKRSTMIAYGAQIPEGTEKLEGFNLPKNGYILYVSRLEPENNPELVIRAYLETQTDCPLLMVGGNVYDPSFVEYLKHLGGGRIIFPGPIYGQGYWQLLRNAGVYISACEVGGYHPALIEAMATGNAVLCLDTPENRETAGDCCVYFRAEPSDLAGQMTRLLQDANLRQDLAHRAENRAKSLFGWDEVTERYEALFSEMLARKTHVPTPASPLETATSPDPKIESAKLGVGLGSTDDHLLKLRVSSEEDKGKLAGRSENHFARSRSDTRRRS
jgi:glycosyltransferase involved in cell wall biosynthesis